MRIKPREYTEAFRPDGLPYGGFREGAWSHESDLADGWRREHAKAVCGAWLGLFNFMAARGQAFEQGFAAGRYDALKSDT